MEFKVFRSLDRKDQIFETNVLTYSKLKGVFFLYLVVLKEGFFIVLSIRVMRASAELIFTVSIFVVKTLRLLCIVTN